MGRLVLDPITRVGGPLRVEVELDGGTVADAWTTGTMYRGIERILVGRDARDAWLIAQRVCGTCGTWHAQAAVRAIEQALGIPVPRNARLVRNLLAGIQLVVDHAAGFYQQQALDWVDLASAAQADPAGTSILARSLSDGPNSSAAYFKAIRQRLEVTLASDQPGPLRNGFWGHPAYRLRPEANLLLATHYLEALDWRRRIMRSHAILGGKSPHPQTYLVGGMSLAPEWGGPTRPVPGEHQWQVEKQAPAALSDASLNEIATILAEAKAFVAQAYLPDVLSIMKEYGDWSAIGRGSGHYLAFGDFAEDDSDRPALLLPRGRVMDADLRRLVGVAESGVGENVDHAWYADDGTAGEQSRLRHPSEGRTEPRYAGPKPPFETLAGYDRYSWVKAPRYEDDPMETGPLARLLVGVASGASVARNALVDATAKVGVGPDGLFSTLGRTVARAAEASVVAGSLERWLQSLRDTLAGGDLAMADITMSDVASWPRDAEGWALAESPGGATGHWVAIHDHRIAGYQIVDGSTWNASPRDATGRRGAMEEALVGTPVADPDRPLEILRTIRSFAPCLACAVH
jgi:Ni,Fe-hydrogenase I large subunit